MAPHAAGQGCKRRDMRVAGARSAAEPENGEGKKSKWHTKQEAEHDEWWGCAWGW